MLKNKKDHYVPDFEHHKHHAIKSVGGEAAFDPLHDYSPVQLGRDKIDEVKLWLQKQPDILAALLIGSYARGEERLNSDIDFILVVEDVEKWLQKNTWVKIFGPVLSMTLEEYEQVRAIRVYYQDSLELEFGFVTPSWLEKPYADSTKKAMDSGLKVLFDHKGLMK